MADTLRLDLFLWHARLAKTRSVAQEIAATGRLRLDGRLIDKPAAAVRIGTVLSFTHPPGQVRVIRVETLPERRGPATAARACYTDLLAGDNCSQEEPSD